MADSIREQLLAAITLAVGGEYGVPAPDDERDLPVIIVQDGQDEGQNTAYDQTNILMPVAVASAATAVSGDLEALRGQANGLLADIQTAMYTDETFGGLADGVDYDAGGIQTELGKFVFAQAQFTVRWHHTRGNPFIIDDE